MNANFCFVLGIISIWICVAVSYSTNSDDELASTGDIDTMLDDGDWMANAAVNDNRATAARKRLYEKFLRPTSMDSQTLGDVRALVQALGAHTDKLDSRAITSDKRAYGEVKTMAEMLRINADKLDNLTGNVKHLIEFENIDKTENLSAKILGKLEEMNVDLKSRLDDMDPKFIAMFAMLTDISFATSLRLAKHEDEMRYMRDYFQNHIETYEDKNTLDRKLSPVFQWYTGKELGPFSSCLEYRKNGYQKDGVYMIRIPTTKKELDVYCDQTTDNGGWLVIQRRNDGSVDFYRGWEEYKVGFGEISKEFWLGNEVIHELTTTAQELRVDLSDFSGNTAYAKYQSFSIGSEAEKYKLSFNGYSGTAGDSLNYHNGRPFSTKDRDNDLTSGSCAQSQKGAWWYNNCHHSNLNGIYYHSDSTGVTWYHWKNKWESLKKTEMKIRPKQ